MVEQQTRKLSSFITNHLNQPIMGVVNGRLAVEFTRNDSCSWEPGTLICDPADESDSYDTTVTRLGRRFKDRGAWSPRN
jgi:hypothetical protein